MKDCVFCKIIKGEIPRDFDLETDLSVVFASNEPEAPIHFLIVPKKHVKNIEESDNKIWADVRKIALDLAKKHKISGFRIANNFGAAAGVNHMHVHFLAEVGPERAL